MANSDLYALRLAKKYLDRMAPKNPAQTALVAKMKQNVDKLTKAHGGGGGQSHPSSEHAHAMPAVKSTPKKKK